MAETYGVYDLRALPLQTAAVLAQGLRADSRIMTKLIAEDRSRSQANAYDTPEAFLAARAEIMRRHNNGD